MDPAHYYTLTEIGIFIATVATALTGVVVAIITAWRTGSKVDKVAHVVDVVEKNTNSKLTKQDQQIDTLVNEVKHLTAMLADQEKSRAVLAAETRVHAAGVAAVPVVVVGTDPVPVTVVEPPPTGPPKLMP